MTSEFENLDKLWEITVLPQPKAPGIAVVPPSTHLKTTKITTTKNNSIKLTERGNQELFDQSKVGGLQQVYQIQVSSGEQATPT